MAGEASSVFGNETAKARYNLGAGKRDKTLERARRASELTIPGLIPAEGQSESSSFSQPYQSLGAQCVANLASRMAIALFPPGIPFFRIQVTEQVAQGLQQDIGEVQNLLAAHARTVTDLMERSVVRPLVVGAFRHLIVAGNCLAYTPTGAPSRLFRIDQYVNTRAADGTLIELVLKESVPVASLSPAVINAVKINASGTSSVEVYTWVKVDPETKVAYWRQEINDTVVPDSEGEEPLETCPWHSLRWLPVPGSDYGRSHVTEYMGDLTSLEDIYKSMVEFTAAAARIINIVEPNSGIDVEELNDAETGSYITGYADRIKTHQLDKSQDWAVIDRMADKIERRVAAAFVLTGNTIRDAERVTAEEIRQVAQELENALGGTYTALAAELQLPLVRRYMRVAVAEGLIPDIPKNTTTPVVVTGFDALGRAHGVNRLRAWASDAISVLGQETFIASVNATALLIRLGEGHGVEGLESLIKSPEEMAAEQQAAQQQMMIQQATPALAGAAADVMAEPSGETV